MSSPGGWCGEKGMCGCRPEYCSIISDLQYIMIAGRQTDRKYMVKLAMLATAKINTLKVFVVPRIVAGGIKTPVFQILPYLYITLFSSNF